MSVDGPSPARRFALVSMTGFGSARGHLIEAEGVEVEVQLKSVNHRALKITYRLADALGGFERAVDDRLRKRLARGAVQCAVRLRTGPGSRSSGIDTARVKALARQLNTLAGEIGVGRPSMDTLLMLPGAVASDSGALIDDDDPQITARLLAVVDEAIAALLAMRADEGEALGIDIDGRAEQVHQAAVAAAARAPGVVREVQARLSARLEELLANARVTPDPEQLAREVAMFADRADIAEEVTRLKHHASQMRTTLTAGGEVGRKLDFIAQEMLREANTIGSKANDGELALLVVDLKSTIDKIKEQVQNVE